MIATNISSFGVKWNRKTTSLFFFLLILPNFLGAFNLLTSWGFQIHFFQLAIFFAALIYGPKGGALSGLIGSTYSALIVGNPYIIFGNAILGFLVGLFSKFGWNVFSSIAFAYCLQLPWLIITDYYLMHLSTAFIGKLVISLALSNIIWAITAYVAVKPIKRMLDV